MAKCDVIVLGAGVTGLTTALALQSIGLRCGILSGRVSSGQADSHSSGHVASDYAMASAYPHNLKVANLQAVSAASQEVFEFLSAQCSAGVQRYRMFEVFEDEPDSPAPLADQRMNFSLFDGRPAALKRTIDPPVRPGAAHLWGWSFDTYFADMPLYMPFLWSAFLENGGLYDIGIAQLQELLVNATNNKVLINCLGLGALEFLSKHHPDKSPAVIVRGHQIEIPGAHIRQPSSALPEAYNYTPTAEVFCRADGKPEYVHFFPRSNGFLLGQTREPGFIDCEGNWQGAAVTSPSTLLGQHKIPSPILSLNKELLAAWRNVDVGNSAMVGRVGYRYYRDPEGTGVRLEAEEIDGHLLLHNYGHGGSGITMSWGCALECVWLLMRKTNLTPESPSVPSKLGAFLHKLLSKQNSSFNLY